MRADITFAEDHMADLISFGTSPGMVLADKGYDSEALHRTIRRDLGCKARIPVRESRGNRGYTVRGMYRRDMLALMQDKERWKKDYGRRSVIESTNFMVKNITGDSIGEHLPASRENRALMKALAFNIDN